MRVVRRVNPRAFTFAMVKADVEADAGKTVDKEPIPAKVTRTHCRTTRHETSRRYRFTVESAR
jgi:hypothetical protein